MKSRELALRWSAPFLSLFMLAFCAFAADPAPTGAPTPLDDRDYETVSGTSQIVGEPGLGKKAGQDNWRTACQNWKDEFNARNSGQQAIALDCNAPAYTIEGGQFVFQSTGSYQVRVRRRDAKPSAKAETQASSAEQAASSGSR